MEHHLINPDPLPPPIGFSHAVESRGGRVVWLSGQNGTGSDGRIIAPGDFVAQFDKALENIVAVVRAAGGEPEHIVKLNLYVSDVQAYRDSRKELGRVYRKHMGRYFPAMIMLGVTGLFDEEALVEIDGFAVIPEET